MFKNLFKPRYTPYEFVYISYEVFAETEQIEDTKYSGGYGISDPLDVKSVNTGNYFVLGYELYVKRHLKTNLPKYHKVWRDDLNAGPFPSLEAAHNYINKAQNA